MNERASGEPPLAPQVQQQADRAFPLSVVETAACRLGGVGDFIKNNCDMTHKEQGVEQ